MRIFLSYSRVDTAIADRLVSDLEAHGFDVDIDRRDLPYGEEWQAELARFIHQADTVVWLASAASVASSWCKWELGEAQRHNKRLLPVRIAPLAPGELPEALGRIHILPAEGIYDPAGHLDDLIKALETDRAWMETHTRLGDRAAEWIARDRSSDRLLRGRALRDAEEWRDNKPARAPAPGSDTLDLLLQSRRAATRVLRLLAGLAVGVALVTIGLSVFAEAIVQADAAEMARDRAQLESARIAVSLAADLPARGQADQALLMLLDAADTFDENPPPDWQVAMHKALDAVDGRTIIPIPIGSLPFETRDGLYLEDPATHDLWHFDGTALTLALQGRPDDSPFAAMDIGPDGLIAIRADLEVVVIASGAARPAGAFTGQRSAYPVGKEGNDIWTIAPDGRVLRDVAFSEPDQLLDTSTGLRLDLPDQPYDPIYYRAPDGRRYIVEAGFGNPDRPSPVLEIVDGAFVRMPADKGFVDEARFADCLLGANSSPLDYSQRVVDNLGEAGLFRARCAVVQAEYGTPYVLMTSYSSGSGGIGRSDALVDISDATAPYDRALDDDLEYSNSAPIGIGEFTWTGVSTGAPDSRIGAIFNRGVFVQDGFLSSGLMRFEPERPAMGAMIGDDRIALVEPRAGRLVIYDYTRGLPRPSLYSPQGDAPGEPLNADLSCVGYDGIGDVVLTDGTAVQFMQETDGADIILRFGSTGRPDVALQLGQYCRRADTDWSRILISGAGETRIIDLARLAGGASVAEATIAMLPRALDAAVVAPATGAIFSRLDEVNIQRWRTDDTGQWRSDIVYEGDLEIGWFEPNADGSALLIGEHQPGSYEHGFLYSIDARAIWVDLYRDYKPSYAPVFATDGSVIMGSSTLRLPDAAALIAEAQAGLAAACAPVTPANYRSSPCWPGWL